MTQEAPKPPAIPRGRGPQVRSLPKAMLQKRLARLAAVQALYQLEIGGGSPEKIVHEFLQHRLEEEVDGVSLGELSAPLFGRLVREVSHHREELDDMLTAVIAEGWAVERLETLLRAILRAGLYELAYAQDVPARAVVSEYVDLAHSFFVEKEPALVNGMLDALARQLRTEEFQSAS